MTGKARRAPPEAHRDQDGCQGQELADLDPDIEGQEVGQEPVRRDVIVDQLGRQAEAVEQAENQRGGLGGGLNAEPALESSQVVQRLVDDGQADNGVDQIGVQPDIEEDAGQHGGGMADGEQADIDADMLEPVEEEDHAEQEEEVVIPRHHVFGAQIEKGDQIDARDLLDIALVALRDPVGQRIAAHQKTRSESCEDRPERSV